MCTVEYLKKKGREGNGKPEKGRREEGRKEGRREIASHANYLTTGGKNFR